MEHIPLAVKNPVGRVGQWMVIKGMEFSGAAAEAFGNYSDRTIDLQINNGSVMICSPVRWKPSEIAHEFALAAESLKILVEKKPSDV